MNKVSVSLLGTLVTYIQRIGKTDVFVGSRKENVFNCLVKVPYGGKVKMLCSTSDKLHLNKSQLQSGHYDMPTPPYGGVWYHLHDQMKAKQKQKQNLKSLNCTCLQLISKANVKANSSEGSGMETNEVE